VFIQMIFRGAWIPTHKFLIAKKSSGWSIASDGMTENIDGSSMWVRRDLMQIIPLLVTSGRAWT